MAVTKGNRIYVVVVVVVVVIVIVFIIAIDIIVAIFHRRLHQRQTHFVRLVAWQLLLSIFIINIIAAAAASTTPDIDDDFVLSVSLRDFTEPSNQCTVFH